ncbi:MAG: putative manganese transporter [Flavobacteriales bacterium]|jgi:hypothetical protein|nr:putative manganese transporter [Flavobacteriales bacterium]
MDFNLWEFIVENLEAAGVIGGYVSISIIGVTLITHYSGKKIKESAQIGPKWAQPIIGGLLGLIPGCGGTIVASSMYKNNKLSFGGLFATFITTLGEGSFVLLGASDEANVAANLTAFMIVNIVGFIVGVVLGYVVDAFGFRVANNYSLKEENNEQCDFSENTTLAHKFIEQFGLYIILALAIFLAPGSIMALWGGEIEAIADLTVGATIALTVISIIYYLVNKLVLKECCNFGSNESIKTTLIDSVVDITLVVTYVFLGLITFNFIIDVLVGAEAFESWMKSSTFVVVIIAALIGATPGCGGMIAVAVTYITIPDFPIAALIAAAIATSGDGIFPLLAENKKDAIIITLAGFIVALVVGFATLALGI